MILYPRLLNSISILFIFADCDESLKNKHASKQVAKLINLLIIYIFSKVKPIYLFDDKIVQPFQETYFEN